MSIFVHTGDCSGLSRLRALLVVVAGALGCTPKAPAVDIDSGDEVIVVRAANRGHELVVAKQGKEATVRLVGIYTFSVWPREKTDVSTFARAAVDFVEQQAGGRKARLILEREEPDPRGRYLGFIEVGGTDLGQRMIEEGHAAVYTEFPFSREGTYMATESGPRAQGRGIWGGRVAARRMGALRETWAAVRLREFDSKVNDPLLGN